MIPEPITKPEEVERYIEKIKISMGKTMAAISATQALASAGESPIDVFSKMKFKEIGFHPIFEHNLNLVEQINQTFTYLVALRATAYLLATHHDAKGFWLAPGAAKKRMFDIMSVTPDLVAAETFAAVDPRNNAKLKKDIEKLRSDDCISKFRYVFFYASRTTNISESVNDWVRDAPIEVLWWTGEDKWLTGQPQSSKGYPAPSLPSN